MAGQLLITASNGDTTRLNRFIRNLYYGALGREPTQTELQTQRNRLRLEGRTGEAELLAESKELAEELFTTYGGGAYAARTPARTDALYVKDLYYVFLQRGEDAGGRTYYLNVLNGTATGNCPGVSDLRTCARKDIEASTEFAALVSTVHGESATEANTTGGDDARSGHWVWNTYLGALERVPNQIVAGTSEEEKAYYARQLDEAAAGGREAVIDKAKEIALMLFNSTAYTSVTRTDEQYVRDLYEVYLQRAPDEAGLAQYTTAAGASGGRASVLNTFAGMTAFRELAGTIYREVNWLVTDHLGTPRMVVDRAGSLAGVKRHDYLPFGEEIGAAVGGRTAGQGYGQSDSVRQRFTSKERDDETGLDYFLARYYSSAQGRFTSPDEFTGGPDELYYFVDDASANPTFYADPRNPQSLNKYQYAYNNPLRYIDPDGHEADDLSSEGDCCPQDRTMPAPPPMWPFPPPPELIQGLDQATRRAGDRISEGVDRAGDYVVRGVIKGVLWLALSNATLNATLNGRPTAQPAPAQPQAQPQAQPLPPPAPIQYHPPKKQSTGKNKDHPKTTERPGAPNKRPPNFTPNRRPAPKPKPTPKPPKPKVVPKPEIGPDGMPVRP